MYSELLFTDIKMLRVKVNYLCSYFSLHGYYLSFGHVNVNESVEKMFILLEENESSVWTSVKRAQSVSVYYQCCISVSIDA